MKIYSIDHKSWLSLMLFGDENYSSYEIEAFVDIGHGNFRAKNVDQIFLNTDEFREELDLFTSDRSLEPSLNGTYDTYIKLYSPKSNIVMIEFSVGDSFCGYTQTVDYSFNGSFEVNQEAITNLLRAL